MNLDNVVEYLRRQAAERAAIAKENREYLDREDVQIAHRIGSLSTEGLLALGIDRLRTIAALLDESK
jgi:molybdopterin synthase catalytic subunit